MLSYSGLGFGGSGCPIELDDPDWDGRAASQLITFLGGGMAATDGTAVDYVVHDQIAHDGRHHDFDPRVGMIGGSYGGEIQFATAEQDPRLDTIVPIITWNDLTYSLAPNNAGLPSTVPSDTVSNAVPGVAKFIWLNAFFGEGAAADGLQQLQNDPTADLTGCPNFNSQVCAAAIQTSATGAPRTSAIALLRHASVESYMSKIQIPTLLAQGEDDTLFTLHEAVATYEALRAQRTPVKMIWQSWGHSQQNPAPGELGDTSGGYAIDDAAGQVTYEGQSVMQWFDHYLKDAPAAPSLDFSFFRPWVRYSGDADPAYGRAPALPGGHRAEPRAVGVTNALVSQPGGRAERPGGVRHPGRRRAHQLQRDLGRRDQRGARPGALRRARHLRRVRDAARWPRTPTWWGSRRSTVNVSAPAQGLTSATGAGGDLVLFFKLYDLSPSGAITLPDKLIAPVRIPAGGGTVQRRPAGHRAPLPGRRPDRPGHRRRRPGLPRQQRRRGR